MDSARSGQPCAANESLHLGEFARVSEAEALYLARLGLSAADGGAMSVPAPRIEE